LKDTDTLNTIWWNEIEDWERIEWIVDGSGRKSVVCIKKRALEHDFGEGVFFLKK